jgi:hypothetical protein
MSEWVFGIKAILKGLFESMTMQRELTHEIVERYGKADEMNQYATYLINDMIEHRNSKFHDAELATRYDEIIKLWRTKEKVVNETFQGKFIGK